jgi:DNA repair protein RecN (Recombination protein N)
MLKYLKISNFAIIDQVEVEFHDGFNVLTGETGAGKSILIGALNLLLGAKASQDVIRTGAEEAAVEGLFEIPHNIMLPEGLEGISDGAGELVLSRKLLRSGRSRCFINGTVATLSMVQRVGDALVSIFGQHEHHVLMESEEHAEILDRSGRLEQHRIKTADAFASMVKDAGDLARAGQRLSALEQQGRENAEAIEELAGACLKAGEEDELLQERDFLKKAVQIRERAFEAYQTLYGRSGSLMAGFADVRKALGYMASSAPRFTAIRDKLEEAVYRMEDVAMELRDVTETLHSDPARLERVDERLTLIRRLKKKYAMDIEELIRHLGTLTDEAGEILDAKSALKNLKSRAQESRSAYMNAARELSTARSAAAEDLTAAMKQELAELAMPEASFTVIFTELDEAKGSASGLEKVEFFLAANPGEDARPLARVASGGELSRIMLALKALQVDTRGTGTVIFDEVDAGIGGHTAFAVGSRLARVARLQQVLCVTHLHQIAALADHHLSVRKGVVQGRTRIEVTPLDRENRVEELTRMLGASSDSEAVKEHVERLMDVRVAEVSG